MRFADVDNVFGIVEADAEVLTCRLILDAQMIDEVLHSIDKCGLTIATTASKQETVLAGHATKPVGNTCNLFMQLTTIPKWMVAIFHFSRDGCCQILSCQFAVHRQLKTSLHRLAFPLPC